MIYEHNTVAAAGGVSVKKGVLKSFAIFTGKHLRCSLIFDKVQSFSPAALLKGDSNTDFFVWILQNLKKNLLMIRSKA